jgi:hypothetical protein
VTRGKIRKFPVPWPCVDPRSDHCQRVKMTVFQVELVNQRSESSDGRRAAPYFSVRFPYPKRLQRIRRKVGVAPQVGTFHAKNTVSAPHRAAYTVYFTVAYCALAAAGSMR